MENIDVARLFQQVADLLELRGDNPFRIPAYRNAARTIEAMPALASRSAPTRTTSTSCAFFATAST